MNIKLLIKKILCMKTPEESQKELLLSKGMKVGINTNIFSWTGIDPSLPYLIEVGDNVTISSNVQILVHDASPCKVGCGTKIGRVTIGNNVFVGAGTTILCNTKIGDNVIVGAGSVATGTLTPNTVYAGAPAKKICSIEEYSEKMHSMRKNRPDFGKIRPWNTWDSATEEEKKNMYNSLADGPGFY